MNEAKTCSKCKRESKSWIQNVLTEVISCSDCFKKSINPDYNPVEELKKSAKKLQKEMKENKK